MYLINKLFWSVGNPFFVALLLAATSFIAAMLRRRRCALIFGGLSLVIIYSLSTPALTLLTGRTLEEPYPYVALSEVPNADAIVCLGGGTGANTNFCPFALLNPAADRPYYAAALWKAGKAPIVVASGEMSENADGKFLVDLGLPKDAVLFENEARNTEEDARLIERMLRTRRDLNTCSEGKIKVLLVTSAWHMMRAILLFERYAPSLEVVPVATDHECLRGSGVMRWGYLWPDAACIEHNVRYLHEWVGWLFYKWFRK